jgi:hypothetical protein
MKHRSYIITSLVVMIFLLLAIIQPGLAAPQAQYTYPPTPTPGPDGRIMYIAQENDTVWTIAAKYGLSEDEFRKLNPRITNDIIIPGQSYLLGYAGPSGNAPTTGPLPAQPILTPSPTASPGWGVLCVLLYNDSNGDSMRQESEPSIQGGEISVSNRAGSVSLTGETPSGGIATNIVNPTPQESGYICFDQLLQGEYLVSVAAPEGYNRTTALNTTIDLEAGQTTQIAFGAQPNSELEAQSAIIPESPRKSPLIGIIGGGLLLVGIGLAIYASLLRRVSSPKSG